MEEETGINYQRMPSTGKLFSAAKILFFFLLLSLNLHPSSGESSFPKGGTEPRGPIELEVGQTLRLKCFVDESTSKYSNELLYFEKNSEPIDTKYVKKIGRSVIMLEMPNMQMDRFSIVCKHNQSGVAYNDVRIGTKPQKVRDFKCFAYNWENLTCQFYAPENHVAVNYNLRYYSTISPSSQFNCSFQPKHKHDDPEKCTISSQSYRRSHEHFKFILNSHNILGELVETFDISNLAIVVPNPVTNITFSSIKSDSVTVSWVTNSVMSAFPKKVDFQFLIESKYSSNKIINLYSQSPSLVEHKLELPYAHTWFAIKMRMKSSLARNHDEMWSKWTNSSVKTEARRPDKPPEMQIGGFNIGNSGDVYIYWKNLDEQYYNGENFSYIVDSDPPPNRITYLYATYSKDRLNYNKNNVITVHSSNEKGKSYEASQITIPAIRLDPPSSIVKTLASEVYNLTWSYPLNTDPHLIESYTVFWCRVKSELPNNCETSVNFITRKPWETFYQHHSNESLNFAVAANSKNSTSGMTWSTCTTRNDYDIGNIKIIWIPKVTSTTIEVEWILDCADQGVVKGYQIEYCPISNPKTLDCEEDAMKVNITESKHTLENLLPYHTYKIDLRMFSATTMGSPLKDPLVNTTSEAAPSVVRNLIARNIGNESVELYWEPPRFPNGVLLYYKVWANNIMETIKEHKVEIGNASNETRMNFTFNNLKPFTKYQILVKACTKDCSDNVTTTIQTTVGVPGIISQPNIQTKSSSHNSNLTDAEISWNEPEFKGGEILFYELKIAYHEVNGKMNEKIVKMKQSRCIFKDLCSSNVKMYGFYIRAVNLLTPHSQKDLPSIIDSRKDQYCNQEDDVLLKSLEALSNKDPHGSYLKGNWSVAISHSCNSKDLSGTTIAVLSGSFIILVMMIVTFRYFYKEYRRMKDIFPQMPPGLEDLTGEKLKKDKKDQEKPDILRNVDNISMNCEDESGELLKTSRNNSLNEMDCSSSIRSESTQSEINYNDDIGYGQFDSIEKDHQDSLKQFIINPTTGEEITLSPTMKVMSTPNTHKMNSASNPPLIAMPSSDGYVCQPPVKPNPSYVAYSIFNPLQSNTPHTTLSAYEKPTNLINNGNNKLKLPIVATTDQDGISGYVTHRQLSDFGHRMQ